MGEVRQSTPDLGVAGWVGILPDRRPCAALEEDAETDFLIVGAGFAGLSAAQRVRQLAPDAKIVIVDAYQVAEGPSGRNSGFMIDLPHVVSSNSYTGALDNDRRDIRLNRAAIHFASNMAKQFNLSTEAFKQTGKWSAAAGKRGVKNNRSYVSHLDALNEPYQIYNAEQMNGLTGIHYYHNGVWTPGTVMIQPALYIRGIADALATLDNCKLYENSPVVALEKKFDQWIAKTPTGSIRANKVILAVNGLIENFGFYQKRLMHVNLYASMTRLLSEDELNALGGAENWGITPADPLGSTVRKFSGANGHRLLIRNRCTYDPQLTTPLNNLAEIGQDHDRTFYRRFPILKPVSMEFRWSGRLCLSRNNAWAVGQVEDNLYAACCQNGLGATKGTIAGIVAAEDACNIDTDSLVPDFDKEKTPNKLLPAPLMTLAARGVLKFREFRAGKEL